MNKAQLTLRESINIKNIVNKKKNQNYYLFGNNISKSPSPFIHNFVFKKINQFKSYHLYETNLVEDLLSILNSKDCFGASITMPFKEKIIKYLDYINYDAKYMGSVSVIKTLNGKYRYLAFLIQ